MRSVFLRCAVVVVSVMLAMGAFAAPPKPREGAAARVVKKFIRVLGDLLTVPTPGPMSGPRQP